ncbi:4-(cytidine 5'-diphospho)-2-C-methyl-D-erythritol kinase [Longirhabdus pacifica]|uniref:4-(cytidine 5'-diphospho)-2-C-methyl-D-erythritol kinase n=1 Tax=Longirhabdus pacifica TaxID=2305227 RepID=UPI001008A5F8|nr:4-(cytidine 5'-diphospho)-2-C-methyl-D-erythritol kinase [Longirhabdus pacifica]
MKVFEKAAAKINLTLDVLHKREDGYHEVEMVMTSIDLADRLVISEYEKDEIILSSSSGSIPLDARNLVYQAAALIKEEYNISSGVKIDIQKNIPVAAGLAGGSSDAAATLRGLNRLWNLQLSTDEIEKLGERLGSDVPFCVTGTTAVARGRGELLQHVHHIPQCWVVLAKPIINASTAEIYQQLNVNAISQRPSAEKMVEAIQQQDYGQICAGLGNVLEQVTISLYPEVNKIKQSMEKLGADGVLMSGSGPTVFALVSNERKARRVYNGLRGFCKKVYVVRSL